MSDDPGMERRPDTSEPAAAAEAEEAPPSTEPAESLPPSFPEPAESSVPPAPKRTPLWRLLLRKLSQVLSSLSVRYKIAGTLMLILSVTVGTIGIVTFTTQTRTLRREMNRRGAVLVRQLANVGKECLLTKQDLPLYAHIADIQESDNVLYAVVTDEDGRVFAHSDMTKKGSIPSGAADKAALQAKDVLIQEVPYEGETVLETAVPIMMKTKAMKIGVARIGLSERELNEAIHAQKSLYLWLSLGFLAAGLVGSFMLARKLTRPLDLLAEGIQVVARGDLRRLVTVSSNDEIGKVTTFFNQMILSLREKIHMEKYLSQSTVRSIKENRDITELRLGGERKYVIALFSDARGFTALSEKMSPEEVVSLMNTYLNLQATVINAFGGIVDKFVGDEVMAIFEGAEGMELNAVRAAQEIQSYCKSMNAARAAAGETIINIGIGVNSGEVVMGNMGSENQMDFTVIGDNINLAARLCGIAQPGQVLVSKSIAERIGDRAAIKELPPVVVKGKDKPVSIAEILGVKGGARRYMRKDMDITVTFNLEGYADESSTAVAKNISGGGCLLEVGSPVAIGSRLNVAISLFPLASVRIHATVVHARKENKAYCIGLCFDEVQDEVRHDIVKWVHRVNMEVAEGIVI